VETESVPLVKAVSNNDLKVVTALLAKGADPNVKSSVEIPVLVMAIKRGSAPVVQVLLKNGADPNVRNADDDSTPLIEAIRQTIDIVKMLLAAGADVDAASRKEGDFLMGYTPLMMAASGGGKDLVQLLLEKGADIKATTPDGFTVLMKAALEGGKDVVQLLLEKGADIKATTPDGLTALMWAAMGGDEEVVQLLLERGADVKAMTPDGVTALSLAREWDDQGDHQGVIRRLEKAAAKQTRGSLQERETRMPPSGRKNLDLRFGHDSSTVARPGFRTGFLAFPGVFRRRCAHVGLYSLVRSHPGCCLYGSRPALRAGSKHRPRLACRLVWPRRALCT
jgi:ankyrin repeat protein